MKTFETVDEQTLLLNAALASKAENRDAIDVAILKGLQDSEVIKEYRQQKFIPFDPVHKRTEATVKGPDGSRFQVSKGAAQVIMDMCSLEDAERQRVEQDVEHFAEQGYRALGVAHKEVGGGKWSFDGILSLFDPPREDSQKTIIAARNYGVNVKMVTGDNLSIARQISTKLGLEGNILKAESLEAAKHDAAIAEQVEEAVGFAEVFPEHKFDIVKKLQARDNIVGMTGDGVNDAPALKQADVGIAVSGATDAARSASDLVLTAPGLSVIINAIEEARRIFERMNSYAIYRISETIRIMLFVVMTMVFFNFYPITAVMIILLAFLNDVPIMTIAYDHTSTAQRPVRWNMGQVLTVSTAMGISGVIGSFGMLLLAREWLHLDVQQIQTYVFLKMAVAGHLILFVARSKDHFWKHPLPAPVMIWSAIITKIIGTLIAAYGIGIMTPITWWEIGLIWGYSIGSAIVTDIIKVQVYRSLGHRGPHRRGFLQLLKHPLHLHGR